MDSVFNPGDLVVLKEEYEHYYIPGSNDYVLEINRKCNCGSACKVYHIKNNVHDINFLLSHKMELYKEVITNLEEFM